jgi:hypothetical protein
MDSIWSEEQKIAWHHIQHAYTTDTTTVLAHEVVDRQRHRVSQEMLQVLQEFRQEKITMREFNTLFQQKTHGSWNVFGIRGMSGGMFLNKLLKYIPDETLLAHHLRTAFQAPKDIREARKRMQECIRFLNTLILDGQVTKNQIQPARMPFLLSVWWHIQDVERWPIFFPVVQEALMSQTKSSSFAHNTLDDYFVFRSHLLALTNVLGLSSWEIEHLLTWYGRKHVIITTEKRQKKMRTPSLERSNNAMYSSSPNEIQTLPENYTVLKKQNNSVLPDEPLPSCHTHLQWLLAKIGINVGCQIWIANNDHSKVWNNERLGSLSLPCLPILANPEFQRVISRIDVLWLQGETIVAAYEIEHTTDISTGLLRLYDLGTLASSPHIQLCVVVPEERLGKVQFELSRPIFQGHTLRKSCAIISERELLQHETYILRWATSPSVIEHLIYGTTVANC